MPPNPSWTEQELAQYGNRLTGIANRVRHRFAMVLSGDTQWGQDAARVLMRAFNSSETVSIGGASRNGDTLHLDRDKAASLLGREFDAVLYDCHGGIDPDTLGIMVGAIRAGGLLLLTTPDLGDWPGLEHDEYRRVTAWGNTPPVSSNYVGRLARVIRESSHCILVRQDHPLPDLPPESARSANIDFSDQETAVEAVMRVCTGQRRKPAVLISDRGRGKSSALGIAAGQLLSSGTGSITVTGSSRGSVANVFKHAQKDGNMPGVLQFVPPDELVRFPGQTDLLLVDEAASIPLPILERLLEIYPRIAFASTVHGYEGTGRGFVLRFREILERHSRGYRFCALVAPVRWADGDPLEAFSYQLLLLDAEPWDPGNAKMVERDLEAVILEQSRLAQDERLLHEVFGLLVQAHYRTRPFDLWHLLDGSNQRLFALTHHGHVAAVAAVVEEGGFDEPTSQKIRSNLTRPRGHLLPELLGGQLGMESAPGLRYARITRIVVHPLLQRQGLGTRLLEDIAAYYAQRVDLLGTTFGSDPGVLAFWIGNGYVPIRVGHTLSPNTGTHPVTLLRGATEAGRGLLQDAAERFFEDLPMQLLSSLNSVDPLLVAPLYRGAAIVVTDQALSDRQFESLAGFAFLNGNLHDTFADLVALAKVALPASRARDNDSQDLEILVEKVLLNRPWSQCSRIGDGGKKTGMRHLREVVGSLLEHHWPDRSSSFRKRYPLSR